MRKAGLYIHLVRFLLVAGTVLLSSIACTGQSGVPDKPVIRYVTVDTADNSVLIYWNPSAASDVEWYLIYKEVETLSGWAGSLIDSVPSSVHYYRHNMPKLDRLEYSVTARDSAGNESIRLPGSHRAMLSSVQYDSCQAELTLRWNGYVGWGSALSGYKVFTSTGGSAFSLFTYKNPGDTSIVFQDIEENQAFRFYIQAIKNDPPLISLSNISEYFTYMPPPPSYMNLDEVDVTDKANIAVLFSADLTGTMTEFQLYRSSSGTSAYLTVGEPVNINTAPYTFTDKVATSATSYSYRVDVINTCSKSAASSNTGNNILLSGYAEGTQAILNWTAYAAYNGSLEGYRIYRQRGESGEDFLTETGPDRTSFTEDISQASASGLQGKVCYRVEAVESNDNPYGIKGNSTSNQCCIDVPTYISMPNAFTPNYDGKNDVFGPVFDFEPEKYLFIIFDRSGKKVFQTTSPGEFWDGTLLGGPMAPEGVYTWFIQFTSYTGSDTQQTGFVAVIYP